MHPAAQPLLVFQGHLAFFSLLARWRNGRRHSDALSDGLGYSFSIGTGIWFKLIYMECERRIASLGIIWFKSLVEILYEKNRRNQPPQSGNLGEPVFRQPGSVVAHEGGMYE